MLHHRVQKQVNQDWFDNIQNDKVEAYKELYDTLLLIGKPLIKGSDSADGQAILDSILDKSGQFISKVDKCTIYISKDEEMIKKQPVAVNPNA